MVYEFSAEDSAQIDTLKAEMATLEGEISTIQAAMDSIEEDLSWISGYMQLKQRIWSESIVGDEVTSPWEQELVRREKLLGIFTSRGWDMYHLIDLIYVIGRPQDLTAFVFDKIREKYVDEQKTQLADKKLTLHTKEQQLIQLYRNLISI